MPFPCLIRQNSLLPPMTSGCSLSLLSCAASFLLLGGCKVPDSVQGQSSPPNLPPSAEATRVAPEPVVDAVQAGDSLEVFVREDPSISGNYKVRDRGYIVLPPNHERLPVAGLTLDQAEKAVKAALEKNQLRKATVFIERGARAPLAHSFSPSNPEATSRSILVYMTGSVKRPGQHVLTLPKEGSLGVYEAILVTGGLSQFADHQKVHLLRPSRGGDKQRIPVNVKQIEQGKQVDPPIGHGDIVVVPERVFGF